MESSGGFDGDICQKADIVVEVVVPVNEEEGLPVALVLPFVEIGHSSADVPFRAFGAYFEIYLIHYIEWLRKIFVGGMRVAVHIGDGAVEHTQLRSEIILVVSDASGHYPFGAAVVRKHTAVKRAVEVEFSDGKFELGTCRCKPPLHSLRSTC